jgi:hypothetical protein
MFIKTPNSTVAASLTAQLTSPGQLTTIGPYTVKQISAVVSKRMLSFETSLIIDEATPAANMLDRQDASLLDRVNTTLQQVASGLDVDPSAITNPDAWTNLNVTTHPCAAVYMSELIRPENLDDVSTTQNATNASKTMEQLVASEKMRVVALADLYEELNQLKAKSSARHGPSSASARQEKLERLQLEQKIERENANLLLLKRKAQATLLKSDALLKKRVDDANGKMASDRTLEDFPSNIT